MSDPTVPEPTLPDPTLTDEAGAATGAETVHAPQVLSGRNALLKAQPDLRRFADGCGQPGAADTLDYFLTQPYTGGKLPHLLLFYRDDARRQVLEGAVLVHQYRLMGVPLGIFVTDDGGGERNVLARAQSRSALAIRAANHLLTACGAHTVVLSLQDGDFTPAATAAGTGPQWAFRQRTLLRRLPLLSNYQDTLNTLGPHTRRNFRLFRRRALSALGCSFVPRAELGEEAFLALNARCDYPVPVRVAQWRFRSAHAVAGGVLAGVRSAGGEWISMVGGRRSHGTFTIDWQMNRSDFARLSPATLMRGFLMEHEIAEGTRCLLFEGGTPHSMQSAFQAEHVTDLVVSARSLPGALLRLLARRVRRPENFLLQTLAAAELQWHDGIEA